MLLMAPVGKPGQPALPGLAEEGGQGGQGVAGTVEELSILLPQPSPAWEGWAAQLAAAWMLALESAAPLGDKGTAAVAERNANGSNGHCACSALLLHRGRPPQRWESTVLPASPGGEVMLVEWDEFTRPMSTAIPACKAPKQVQISRHVWSEKAVPNEEGADDQSAVLLELICGGYQLCHSVYRQPHELLHLSVLPRSGAGPVSKSYKLSAMLFRHYTLPVGAAQSLAGAPGRSKRARHASVLPPAGKCQATLVRGNKGQQQGLAQLQVQDRHCDAAFGGAPAAKCS